MKAGTKSFLFWTPRIATILFALFLSIFAGDVFEQGYGFFELILALFMHLIPTLLILIILAVSWKWEWVGGILYIALGVYYIIISWNRFEKDVLLIIPTPLIILGILFLIGWFKRAEIRLTKTP
jgi:hypothetical protein